MGGIFHSVNTGCLDMLLFFNNSIIFTTMYVTTCDVGGWISQYSIIILIMILYLLLYIHGLEVITCSNIDLVILLWRWNCVCRWVGYIRYKDSIVFGMLVILQ
jgi:hypothetical protein